MSAQLSQSIATRLLIAARSENNAQELDSLLRNAGIATKPLITDDLAHICSVLADGETDLAIFTEQVADMSEHLPRMREQAPRTPIIVLTDDADEHGASIAQALANGATDAIPASAKDHLALAVKRELEHVSEREHFQQLRRALKEAEQRCQLLLQGSKSAIAYIHEGMHIHANEGYLKLFGFHDVDDLIGVSLVDLLDEASSDLLKAQLKHLRSGADDTFFEFSSKPAVDDESGQAVSGTMTLANSQYEGESCLQITVRSQSDSAADAAEDGQTSAPASAAVAESSELELPGFIQAATTYFSSTGEENYLLVVTLDQPERLREAHGVVGLDVISRNVWQQIKDFSSDDTVCRLNQYQYAVAISGASREAAEARADALRKSVEGLTLEVQEKTVRPTVTIAAEQESDGVSLGKQLDGAYQRLADALKQERSNTLVFPEVVAEETDWDDADVILRQITEAIEKKTFVLLYQPIISLRGDADEHYEVFLRMLNSDGDQIEPAKFLQTAIDNKVAGKIDRWVILQAIKTLAVHRAKGHNTRVTINISANSICDKDFPQWLGVAIKASRLPSDAVIFQITEKDATTYERQSREFVDRLNKMHCRASLSRFGLIDEPMQTLNNLPVEMVKLDGSYVQDEEEDKQQQMLKHISGLQAAGKLTIVPMVENAGLLSTLWQAGANYIQGHYLQEPRTDMDYDFSTEE